MEIMIKVNLESYQQTLKAQLTRLGFFPGKWERFRHWVSCKELITRPIKVSGLIENDVLLIELYI